MLPDSLGARRERGIEAQDGIELPSSVINKPDLETTYYEGSVINTHMSALMFTNRANTLAPNFRACLCI